MCESTWEYVSYSSTSEETGNLPQHSRQNHMLYNHDKNANGCKHVLESTMMNRSKYAFIKEHLPYIVYFLLSYYVIKYISNVITS